MHTFNNTFYTFILSTLRIIKASNKSNKVDKTNDESTL